MLSRLPEMKSGRTSRSPGKKITLALAVVVLGSWAIAQADEVTDWNKNLLKATLDAKTAPLPTGRIGALVQSAVFDALNGIERRYQPIHVPANAPRGASRRAAVVQAAYAMLLHIYPDQKATLDGKLTDSLARLLQGGDSDNDQSIAGGLAWGQYVADAIWTWRSADGITPAPPPFYGGSDPGEWRPTAPGSSGATPQFAHMTPWAIQSPSQFLPPGPPALTSAQYTADFNEVKALGGVTSTLRTADQTLLAQFWQTDTPTYWWNSAAVSLAEQRHYTLSDNAYLLGMLNIAIADAGIACWNSKYHYVFWRPVTAIQLAGMDGNPATIADATWTPMLLVTPPFPDYVSGHTAVSGAATTVLADFFGADTPFSLDSRGMPGVIRSFASFSAALQEVNDARVLGGIHFRTACDDGAVCGRSVANYILTHAMLPIQGHTPQNVLAAEAPQDE